MKSEPTIDDCLEQEKIKNEYIENQTILPNKTASRLYGHVFNEIIKVHGDPADYHCKTNEISFNYDIICLVNETYFKMIEGYQKLLK